MRRLGEMQREASTAGAARGCCNVTRMRIPIITAGPVELRADFDTFLARGNALLRDSDTPSPLRTDVSVSCTSRWTRNARTRAAARTLCAMYMQKRAHRTARYSRRTGVRDVNAHFRRDFSVPVIMHVRSDGFLNQIILRPVSRPGDSSL